MVAPALLGMLLWQASSAAGWKELGLKLAGSSKLQSARDAFAKACDLAPEDEDACYFLARTLFTLGRYEEAREPFEKALRAAPQEKLTRAHRAAALNFVALTSPVEAERHFREAVRLNRRPGGSDDDPRIDYGAFLFRQGRAEEALQLLEQAVKALPESARANIELGRVLLQLGKPEAAVTRLEKGLERNPDSWTARLLLGKAYLQLGRTEDGEKQMRLGQEGWKQRYDSGSSNVR